MKKVKNINILIKILLVFIISVITLRGNTPDTQIYWYIFENTHKYNLFDPVAYYDQTGIEIGVGWLNYIISIFSKNKFVYFFLISALIFYFILMSSKILRIPYYLTLLIYLSSSFFFIQQFMQIRQGLAIAISMYAAIRFLNTEKKLSSYLLFILSVFLHQTAIIFTIIFISFMLYDSVIYKIKNRDYIPIILITISIFFVKYIVMPVLIIISTRVASYTMIEQYSFARGLFSLPNIRTALILCVIFFLSNKPLFSDKAFRFLFFCLVVAFIFRIGFSSFAILNGRLSTVASFAEIFIIPIVLFTRFSLTSRIVIALILFVSQTYISLFIQSPIILETYFTPFD